MWSLNNNYPIISVKNLTCTYTDSLDKKIIAVNDFTYDFLPNQIYFIIGNSGSGKTTLVNHFNGLLKAKVGEIRIADFEIKPKPKKIKNIKKLRRLISMVFQFPEYQLFKNTVESDIAFGPISLKIPEIKTKIINENILYKTLLTTYWNDIKNKLKIDVNLTKQLYEIYQKSFSVNNFDLDDIALSNNFKALLNNNNLTITFKFFAKTDLVKIKITNLTNNITYSQKIKVNLLTDFEYTNKLAEKYLTKMGMNKSFLDASPFSLSGGQKRRVAIAGILAIQPQILVFDEPTAGLDPEGESEMMNIILEAKNTFKQTVIVITHSMDHVLEIGDHVLVLDEGKILMHGKPYEIFTNSYLYTKTKMDKPKVIKIIDQLVAKNPKFNQLYELKPKNIDELASYIKKIVTFKN